MRNMKKLGKALLCAALPLGSVMGGALFHSCTDTWDDHYRTETLGDGTLWQAMANDSELSNFLSVLEACDYEASLGGSQVFTIFAPVNSSFTETMRDSVIALYKADKAAGVKETRNRAVKEFVMNHVALYNYSVSSLTNDSIVMMNGKYVLLTESAFESGSLLDKNIVTTNGVLFKVSSLATYQPNIYEYLGRDADLDSLRNYIYSYSLDVFDPTKSVPGEIKNGKIEYLDSVTTFKNALLSSMMDADLNDEDSIYWMLAPTNGVWDALLSEYQTYYQYDDKVATRDSLMFNFPRRAIVEGTTFSVIANSKYNVTDSILSTLAYPYEWRKYAWGSSDLKYYQFDRPFDEGGIFENTTDFQCSNGVVKKTDKWNVDKTNTFMTAIVMEGASNKTFDSVYSVNTRDPKYGYVSSDNEYYNKVYNNSYVEVAPTSTSNFQILFDVRDVLSNIPYDIYIVALPLTVQDPLAKTLPTDFRVTVKYHDTTGKEVNFPATSAFTPDHTRIDTVHIGTFTFPTCSYSLSEPQVKLLVEGRTSATKVRQGTATKTLLMDCIIFKPKVD